ncbi:diacylglycerol/polyprenol kinase family protein [Methanolobus halotolerans]|uniref:CTP--2, 3-di-O-geranylgeranyl-sn-glycero-1-phosphate cytidyltransferase n=1 Tax=Methanolobus halotolerans TaxID=2052935 RepID=A0A4E0QAM4_9EURY|nr:diacylglycerol/polyprenol kinase family protein [Methanolobus halotolerans]TGC09507.1 CTP--2,3-di-O-geranylgeranyl-sn-glycero-1-phosphate cytidyltransferase [Methanolobus halotolerans]
MASKSFFNEIVRKGIHLTSILIVLVYAFFGKQATLSLLITYLVIILTIEHLRLDRGFKLPFVSFLLRKKEVSGLGSHVYFTLGALIAVAVFSEHVAYAAILMTTFGDASAALVGKRIGKIRIFGNGKSLEGLIAELCIDLVIGYIFLSSWQAAILMAAVATMVETYFVKIDDNLAIPIFSGFSVEILFFLSSYF